jgi:bacteriorhodopsin
MKLVKYTAYLSLLVQFITGIIDFWGLQIEVPENIIIFKDLLFLELLVQIVEFIFYIWLVRNIENKNITKYRYFDWFVTTPTMLLTLMVYLDVNRKEKSILEYVKNNMGLIVLIFILNAFMLFFGLLGELGVMKEKYAVLLGFIPFILYYYIIYKKFIQDKNLPSSVVNVYWYFLFVWGLYGVAALLPFDGKNSMYNILDLFSKNFFGLFLVYIIYINRK